MYKVFVLSTVFDKNKNQVAYRLRKSITLNFHHGLCHSLFFFPGILPLRTDRISKIVFNSGLL